MRYKFKNNILTASFFDKEMTLVTSIFPEKNP